MAATISGRAAVERLPLGWLSIAAKLRRGLAPRNSLVGPLAAGEVGAGLAPPQSGEVGLAPLLAPLKAGLPYFEDGLAPLEVGRATDWLRYAPTDPRGQRRCVFVRTAARLFAGSGDGGSGDVGLAPLEAGLSPLAAGLAHPPTLSPHPPGGHLNR